MRFFDLIVRTRTPPQDPDLYSASIDASTSAAVD
jgi:hypothetical protein